MCFVKINYLQLRRPNGSRIKAFILSVLNAKVMRSSFCKQGVGFVNCSRVSIKRDIPFLSKNIRSWALENPEMSCSFEGIKGNAALLVRWNKAYDFFSPVVNAHRVVSKIMLAINLGLLTKI